MAEEGDSGEKEFDATEQRKLQARQDGDVPMSKETNAFAVVIGIIGSILLLNSVLGDPIFSKLAAIFYHSDAFALDAFTAEGEQTRDWIISILLYILPILTLLFVIVILTLVASRSIAFSTKKIKPDPKKLSPIDNLKKKYGKSGLTDFAKDTAKMIFAGLIASVFLFQFARNYYASSAINSGDIAQFTFEQVLNLIIAFGIFQFALAVIDFPLQQNLHATKIKMTREEVKKEQKQSEGDPHVKQQRREKATKISRGEMIKNVKDATVIMVNPEHYAVALKWDPDTQKAPVVVAKGVDNLAAKIREIALENNIPIYRDPPSTRSIYRLVDIDEEIHAEHFAAVAAAIQFVDSVRKHS